MTPVLTSMSTTRDLKRTHNGYLRPAEIVRYPRNVAIIGSPAALAVGAVAF